MRSKELKIRNSGSKFAFVVVVAAAAKKKRRKYHTKIRCDTLHIFFKVNSRQKEKYESR